MATLIIWIIIIAIAYFFLKKPLIYMGPPKISPQEAQRQKKIVWDKWDKINEEKIRKENLVSYSHDMTDEERSEHNHKINILSTD